MTEAENWNDPTTAEAWNWLDPPGPFQRPRAWLWRGIVALVAIMLVVAILAGVAGDIELAVTVGFFGGSALSTLLTLYGAAWVIDNIVGYVSQ